MTTQNVPDTGRKVFKNSITNKVFTAAEVAAMCKDMGIPFEDGDEKKVVEFIASDEKSDRDGDVMQMNGMDADNFKSNPVFLWAHEYDQHAIGNVIKLVVDKTDSTNAKLVITVLFQTITDEGKDLCALALKRVLRAVSIGFRAKEGGIKFPSEAEREALNMRPGGVIFMEWELYEVSLCPVGCNPRALAKAQLHKKTFDLLKKQMLINISDSEEIDMTPQQIEKAIKDGIEAANKGMTVLLATVKAGGKMTAEHVKDIHDCHKCLNKAAKHIGAVMADHLVMPEDGELGGVFTKKNVADLTAAIQHGTKAVVHAKSVAAGHADPEAEPDDTSEAEEENQDKGAKTPKEKKTTNVWDGFLPEAEPEVGSLEAFNRTLTEAKP